MANYNKVYSNERQLVEIFARATVSTTGVVALTGANPGVSSVTQDGTGVYTVAFGSSQNGVTVADKYQGGLLNLNVVPLLSGSDPAFKQAVVIIDETDTSGTFQFTTVDATGTAVDPTSGSVLLMKFELRGAGAR